MLMRLIPTKTEVPFIKFRFISMGVSAFLMVASIALFVGEGLNYGIDFVGGTLIEVSTPEPANLGDIRTVVRDLNLGDVQVQSFGNENDVLIRLEAQEGEGREGELAQRAAVELTQDALDAHFAGITFALQDYEGGIGVQLTREAGFEAAVAQAWLDDHVIAPSELLELDATTMQINLTSAYRVTDGLTEQILDQDAMVAQLEDELNSEYSPLVYRRTEVVGPKVSGELVEAGTLAVVLSVLAVLIYIWFRFEWQFSVGAVAALVHDVVLTIGVFSLLRLEFNLSIIAALLTIVGYSLNDTVVVFDRVREKLRKYKRMALPELLDFAINKTLSRTLMTSLTTLLALIALYAFGGEVIRGFTFAMIWGVVVGTYSSIFIASPILLMLGVKRDWSGNSESNAAAAARP